MSDVVSANGVSIHYSIEGDRQDLIAFVHCWAGDQSYWRNQVPFFQSNFQVVTLDLAGHGNSGKNRDFWTISSFGDDVVAVINELEYARLYLVGHSMGGMVTLDAASKIDRVDKLILVDSFSEKYWPMAEDEVQKAMEPFQEDFSDYTYDWVRSELFAPETDLNLAEWIAKDISKAQPQIAIASLRDMLAKDYDPILERARSNTESMYLLNSDRWETDGNVVEMGFKTETIKGVGHFPMLEAPQRFNQQLLTIISG